MADLTGQSRYRIKTRWFGHPLLVLQLQWKGAVPHHAGSCIEVTNETWWLDAKPENIMEFGLEITYPEKIDD